MCADEFREQYVVGQQIGSGTFGLVYAGKDKYTGAPVALKQIEAEDGEAPLEVQVLAKMKHHAITPIIERSSRPRVGRRGSGIHRPSKDF